MHGHHAVSHPVRLQPWPTTTPTLWNNLRKNTGDAPGVASSLQTSDPSLCKTQQATSETPHHYKHGLHTAQLPGANTRYSQGNRLLLLLVRCCCLASSGTARLRLSPAKSCAGVRGHIRQLVCSKKKTIIITSCSGQNVYQSQNILLGIRPASVARAA